MKLDLARENEDIKIFNKGLMVLEITSDGDKIYLTFPDTVKTLNIDNPFQTETEEYPVDVKILEITRR